MQTLSIVSHNIITHFHSKRCESGVARLHLQHNYWYVLLLRTDLMFGCLNCTYDYKWCVYYAQGKIGVLKISARSLKFAF